MTTLTIPTFLSGAPLSGTDETQVATLLNFVINPPRFVGRQTGAQALANSTWTAITLDAEDIDNYNGHSTSANTSRYTATQAGWYMFEANVTFVANATGIRWLALQVNGLTTDRRYRNLSLPVTGGNDHSATTGGAIYLNGTTDYVEMVVAQSSGGSLNTAVASDGAPGSNPRLAAWFIGSSAT